MQQPLGIGLGFRPDFYNEALAAPDGAVDWYEVVSENFMGGGGRPRRFLSECRARFPMALHGVGMSIGSIEPLDRSYLARLNTLIGIVEPAFVSDHLCWTSFHGHNSHDLLPLPYTKARLAAIVDKLDEVQSTLGRRFYLENPSAYVAFAGGDYDEAGFLRELCRQSGCGILLDLNNLYVNQQNLGINPWHYLEQFQADDICYFHLAGHSEAEGVRIDTHDHPVHADVWQLFQHATRLFPEVPAMLEWDDRFPPFAELVAEVSKMRMHRHEALASSGSLAPSYSEFWTKPEEAPASPQCWADQAVMAQFFHGITVDPELEPEAAAALPDLLQADTPTTPIIGVGVYAAAYNARLGETLSAVFPGLQGIFHCHGFAALCRTYLTQMPPEHWDIKQVGARLATFVREGILPGDLGVERAAISELARLEWTIESLYDLPDALTLSAQALADIPEDSWESVRFASTASWKILHNSYELKSTITQSLAGEAPEKPTARYCRYLVYRLDEEIFWEEISHAECLVIESLAVGDSFLSATEKLATHQARACEESLGESLAILKRHCERGGIRTWLA